MSTLIKEFKIEHSKIINSLKEVKEFGILTHKGQAKLMSAKSSLHEHLNNEKEKLYPFFYKAAEQDKKLKKLLELFANDLESVSKDVAGFFDKYSKGALDTIFIEEFENLFVALYERLMYEEFLLYDEYEELNKL